MVVSVESASSAQDLHQRRPFAHQRPIESPRSVWFSTDWRLWECGQVWAEEALCPSPPVKQRQSRRAAGLQSA